MTFCKKLKYSVLNNEKLDWLKREKYWKFDKIDAFIGLPTILVFLLVFKFGEVLFFPMMLIFAIGSFIGTIRQIKTTPGDIESKLMSPSICAQGFFVVGVLIISFVIFVGRL